MAEVKRYGEAGKLARKSGCVLQIEESRNPSENAQKLIDEWKKLR